MWAKLVELIIHGFNATAQLRTVRESGDSLTLVLTPAERALSASVQKWAEEHLQSPAQFRLAEDGGEITFATVADAVLFKLRWC